MSTLTEGINNFFWINSNSGRLSGDLENGEIDLRTVVTSDNTNIIYEIGSTGYRSFNPANSAFAPFKALSTDKAYLINTKSSFAITGILLPTDPIGGVTPNPTFADTLVATGTANTVQADGISLVGNNGDELRYNALTGSNIPCSMNLYTTSISAANQVASIGFPAVYAGSSFAYKVGTTVYTSTFQASGEIILNG